MILNCTPRIEVAAPAVTVAAPAVAVVVEADLPAAPAPQVTVHLPDRQITTALGRDKNGYVIEATQHETTLAKDA